MSSIAAKPKYDPCLRPFYIAREQTNLGTGEVNFQTFEKRCGTRRKDLCEPCSVIWKDDAYFALMTGAKGYQGEITFITLTAPGWKTFGKAHTANHTNKKSGRCACREYHEANDILIGLPLDRDSFNHRKVIEFNHLAPRLTAITLQKIWRLLATETQTSVKNVKRPTARVMEWQDRGLLHVHIVVLGKIPANIVKVAVNGRNPQDKKRRVTPSIHNGIRWGNQVDVKYANAKNSDEIKKLSGYVTKVIGYAVKDVTRGVTSAVPAHNAHRQTLRSHTNEVIKCSSSPFECAAADLGENPSELLIAARRRTNLCRKHYRGKHQLGFTGNVLSLNRKWGTTLGAAKKARQAFAEKFRSAQNTAKVFCFNTEKISVSHHFLGRDPKNVKRLLARLSIARTVRQSGEFTPLLT